MVEVQSPADVRLIFPTTNRSVVDIDRFEFISRWSEVDLGSIKMDVRQLIILQVLDSTVLSDCYRIPDWQSHGVINRFGQEPQYNFLC